MHVGGTQDDDRTGSYVDSGSQARGHIVGFNGFHSELNWKGCTEGYS